MHLVEPPREAQQRREAAGPLKERRLVGLGRVVEVRVPVHPAAERLVLRLAAAAQAVVLVRRAVVADLGMAFAVEQFDRAGDAVGAVL